MSMRLVLLPRLAEFLQDPDRDLDPRVVAAVLKRANGKSEDGRLPIVELKGVFQDDDLRDAFKRTLRLGGSVRRYTVSQRIELLMARENSPIPAKCLTGIFDRLRVVEARSGQVTANDLLEVFGDQTLVDAYNAYWHPPKVTAPKEPELSLEEQLIRATGYDRPTSIVLVALGKVRGWNKFTEEPLFKKGYGNIIVTPADAREMAKEPFLGKIPTSGVTVAAVIKHVESVLAKMS